MQTLAFGSRARVATLLARVEDATHGNRDGVLGNESRPAGTGATSPNPLAFMVRQALSLGWSKRDDEAKLTQFLASVERRWGTPVSNLTRPAHVAEADWNTFRISKAAALRRFERTPADVTEMIVPARGSVDGETIAPRDLFVQRYAPTAPANGTTLVFAPGYGETTRTYVEQATLASQLGYEVYVFDQQWLGLSQGVTGAVDRGFGVARDIAVVTAKAAARGARDVVVVGTSMGGMGAFMAMRMNELGKLRLDGPAMPATVAAVVQSPYFATEQSIAAATRWLDKVPFVPDWSLPRFAASRVSDDPATRNKMLGHLVIERMNGRTRAFHAADADIARLAALTRPSQGTPIYIIHGQRDPLADYATTMEWAKRIGPRAHLHSVDTMNHAMAENPLQQTLILDGLAWIRSQRR